MNHIFGLIKPNPQDKREALYYAAKRFFNTAVSLAKQDGGVKFPMVAFFYETPFNAEIYCKADEPIDAFFDVATAANLSRDEITAVLFHFKFRDNDGLVKECADRGYTAPDKMPFGVCVL